MCGTSSRRGRRVRAVKCGQAVQPLRRKRRARLDGGRRVAAIELRLGQAGESHNAAEDGTRKRTSAVPRMSESPTASSRAMHGNLTVGATNPGSRSAPRRRPARRCGSRRADASLAQQRCRFTARPGRHFSASGGWVRVSRTTWLRHRDQKRPRPHSLFPAAFKPSAAASSATNGGRIESSPQNSIQSAIGDLSF
jgi:hypothetical protein